MHSHEGSLAVSNEEMRYKDSLFPHKILNCRVGIAYQLFLEGGHCRATLDSPTLFLPEQYLFNVDA